MQVSVTAVPQPRRERARSAWCALLLATFAPWVPACKERHASATSPDTALADDAAGRTCRRDSDCPGGTCVSVLHILAADSALTAPDGYCTRDCENDSECGAQGLCSVPAGEARGECLARCDAHRPCREGYDCVGESALLNLAGTCQPKPETDQLEDGIVGQACASNRDCGGGLCFGKTPVGESLPDQYCTGRCLSDADCGAGGGCLGFAGSGRPGTCLLRCETDADCVRPGYRCRAVGAGFDACYPASPPLPDHIAGKPCSETSECGGEPAMCAQSLPSFGGAERVEVPGGYCTQACALDSDCGAGGQCISRGAQGALCFGVCASQDDCRDGYECVVHGRDHDDDERICVPLT